MVTCPPRRYSSMVSPLALVCVVTLVLSRPPSRPAGATEGGIPVLGSGTSCGLVPGSLMSGGGKAEPGGGADEACASTCCAWAAGRPSSKALATSHGRTFTTHLPDRQFAAPAYMHRVSSACMRQSVHGETHAHRRVKLPVSCLPRAAAAQQRHRRADRRAVRRGQHAARDAERKARLRRLRDGCTRAHVPRRPVCRIQGQSPADAG